MAADRYLNLRHQAADLDRFDASYQLIASADLAHDLFAVSFGFASGSEEQLVHFSSRDTVMASCGLDAANFFLVDPLLDGGKADAELQSGVTQFEQLCFAIRDGSG